MAFLAKKHQKRTFLRITNRVSNPCTNFLSKLKLQLQKMKILIWKNLQKMLVWIKSWEKFKWSWKKYKEGKKWRKNFNKLYRKRNSSLRMMYQMICLLCHHWPLVITDWRIKSSSKKKWWDSWKALKKMLMMPIRRCRQVEAMLLSNFSPAWIVQLNPMVKIILKLAKSYMTLIPIPVMRTQLWIHQRASKISSSTLKTKAKIS